MIRQSDQPITFSGRSGPRRPISVAAAYADVISAIDSARLPFLLDESLGTGGEDGQDGGEGGEDGQGKDKPKKRGGQRLAVECACQPPRKLHMTPRQIEDGPVICGVCGTSFEAPEDSDQDKTEEN